MTICHAQICVILSGPGRIFMYLYWIYQKIVIKELDLPCTGGNKLVLKEAGSTSKGICGKKPPPITSTANAMEFVLMLNAPGKHVSPS